MFSISYNMWRVCDGSKAATELRQTEGKSKRTKPLRIKAAPLLTPSRLRSTTRSIFKHNIHCSIFPQLTPSHGMNNTTEVCSEGNANKDTNTQRRVAEAYEIHVAGCWRVHACSASVCWKPDQRGHYWRQLDSSAAAHELELCLSPSLTLSPPPFLFPSLSPLTCPAQSASIPSNPALASSGFSPTLRLLFFKPSRLFRLHNELVRKRAFTLYTHTYIQAWAESEHTGGFIEITRQTTTKRNGKHCQVCFRMYWL